tara:strand:- start:138 stop:377 length:240 start_codon:yes stop_codon:yes gene_type:complete
MPRKIYGKTEEEEKLELSIESREITQKILNYGVTQFQIAKIIYLLSLELEDRNVLSEIAEAIKPLLSEDNDNNSNIIIS